MSYKNILLDILLNIPILLSFLNEILVLWTNEKIKFLVVQGEGNPLDAL